MEISFSSKSLVTIFLQFPINLWLFDYFLTSCKKRFHVYSCIEESSMDVVLRSRFTPAIKPLISLISILIKEALLLASNDCVQKSCLKMKGAKWCTTNDTLLAILYWQVIRNPLIRSWCFHKPFYFAMDNHMIYSWCPLCPLTINVV